MIGFTRVAEYRGKKYLIPACENCQRDDYHVRIREMGCSVIVDCSYCEHLWTPTEQEIHRMREPERLEARLAEIRSGGGW